MAEVIVQRKQKNARKDFIKERKAKGFNQKSNDKIATILNILSVLLDEHSREGLLINEIATKANRTRQTINNAIYELEKSFGVVEKRGEKWFANDETGRFYQALLEENFGYGKFKPAQIKIFENYQLKIGNQVVNATGSIWTKEFTKETDINKLIASDNVNLIIIKPAGGQPPKL